MCRDGSKRAHREKDEEGCTPLLVAAKNGDKVTLGSLLEHISQLVVSNIKSFDCTCSYSITLYFSTMIIL